MSEIKNNKAVITSLKDGAYKQALANDSLVNVAKYAIEKIHGFPEALPDEAKAQLVDGYRLRFNENNPPVEYAIVDNHYIVATKDHAKYERVKVGVDYAYSFTQQQFGRLKNENPYLYELIKPLRDKCSTYCSNRISDLKRQARTLLMSDKKGNRSATLDFAQRVVEVFNGDNGLKAKCKTAKARGDETANEAKLTLAINAFMVAWNK